MGNLTITHDGTTGELVAHVAELQRKALAYDALVAELSDLATHLQAYANSYATEQGGLAEKLTTVDARENSGPYQWAAGKGQAYGMAASKIREAIAG